MSVLGAIFNNELATNLDAILSPDLITELIEEPTLIGTLVPANLVDEVLQVFSDAITYSWKVSNSLSGGYLDLCPVHQASEVERSCWTSGVKALLFPLDYSTCDTIVGWNYCNIWILQQVTIYCLPFVLHIVVQL